jgi:hypothetical protein
LQNKYREYLQALWPDAFSCSNKCRNQFSQQGREDKCSLIIYVADSDTATGQYKADFIKWVKNQPDGYILDGNEKHYSFQFVFNEEMHQFFDPLPKKNNLKASVSKQTKTNLGKAFGSYTKDNTHCISMISTIPYNAKDSLAENVKLDFADVISTLSLMFGDADLLTW